VHDIPANATALGFQAPVHALITGRKDERDRRIAISAAPRFGIVGQVQTITYRLDDQGVTGERAKVVVRRDGEVINERTVQSGQTVNVEIDIKHAGPNIVEIEASPLDNELTQVNNRAVVAIDGVRDKLRVLLSRASRIPENAPGAICSSPTPASISCISRFCVLPKSRMERRSTNCR